MWSISVNVFTSTIIVIMAVHEPESQEMAKNAQDRAKHERNQ